MQEDTIALLKQCNAGCKTATNSMEQMLPNVTNKDLQELIEKYNRMHIELGDEYHQRLEEYGSEEKDPTTMAKAMTWMTTGMKLLLNDDDNHEAASILMDGCNMGIKTVAENLNKYTEADIASINLARKLIKLEQDFAKDLLAYL